MVESEKWLSIPVNDSELTRLSYVPIASVGENPRSHHAVKKPVMKNFEGTVSRECLKGSFEGKV